MNCNSQTSCGCDFNIKTVGVCDVSKLNFDGGDRSSLNWTEISVPEILAIPELKPEIENIDQVYAKVMLTSVKLIETPFAYRRYPLCYLLPATITAIENLLTTIGTDFTAIDTSVNLIIDVLDQIGALALPADMVEIVTDLSGALTDALTGVTDAVDNLTTALVTGLASVVCAALEALRVALQTLLDLVASVTGVVNGILQQVSPLLQDAINLIITTVLGGASIATFVNGVTASIQLLLDDVLDIDCNPGYVYGIVSNAEGTCLTGRKLIVEGVLKQKIVYTAEVEEQSVHSAHYEVPFIAFLIPYAKFENLGEPQTFTVYDEQLDLCREISAYQYADGITDNGLIQDLNEEFNVTACIEDIYVKALEPKKVFKNVTVFLKATPKANVVC